VVVHTSNTASHSSNTFLLFGWEVAKLRDVDFVVLREIFCFDPGSLSGKTWFQPILRLNGFGGLEKWQEHNLWCSSGVHILLCRTFPFSSTWHRFTAFTHLSNHTLSFGKEKSCSWTMHFYVCTLVHSSDDQSVYLCNCSSAINNANQVVISHVTGTACSDCVHVTINI